MRVHTVCLLFYALCAAGMFASWMREGHPGPKMSLRHISLDAFNALTWPLWVLLSLVWELSDALRWLRQRLAR